jgi:5-(aminomethyl)-3-furanmethanol phosphate kinase
LLPQGRVIASPRTDAPLGILDMFAFAEEDENRPDHLPHTWNVTSDSLAVRAAMVAGAREVVLLKSIDWDGSDWSAGARAGVVDAHFPQALLRAPDLRVRWINLRTWQPP